MALLVQKYGGTSVGSIDRIQHVASKIIKAKQEGHSVVVVVSAMHGETDRLIQLANSITPNPAPREYDALVATGEQVSMSLLSIALTANNCPAIAFTGQQAGIMTDDVHTKARILRINQELIANQLSKGLVVIVAGFQGINSAGDIT